MPRLSPPPISRFGLTGGQPLAPYADLGLPPPPMPPQAMSQRAFAPFFQAGPGQGSAAYPSSASSAPYNAYVQAAQWMKGQTDRGLVPELLMGGMSDLTNKKITGQYTGYLDHVGAAMDLLPPGVDDLAKFGVAGAGSLMSSSAKNWDKVAEAMAKNEKRLGKTDDEIWKKTGDYFAMRNIPQSGAMVEPKTGKVFTEYSDVGAQFNPEGFAHGLNERLMEADDALILKRLSDEMGNVQVNDMPVSEAVLGAFRQRYNREPNAGSWAASARASDELFDITLKEFNVPGPLSAKQGDVLNHPLQYKAYPESRDVPINVVDRGPNTKGGMVSGYGEPPRMTLSPSTAVDTSPGPGGALGVIAHENTHGFPQGATVGAATGASPSRDLSMQWAESEADRLGIAADSPEQAEYLFEMWRRREGNPSQFDQDVYQKTVGEEQARAVQKRMLLPLERLRQNPFHRSMDTPMAEQWVSRLSEGNAPQVGLPPPT